MAILTRTEYETMRICELDNSKYNLLVRMLDRRTGRTGKAESVIRKHWKKTLKQFDDNGYLSIMEVFTVA